jgi:DHA2 family multidrug resistance protein
MAILDIQITNASIREIQGSLGLDFSEAGWISTAYLIAEIIVIPLTGYLSKVFGIRRYLLVNCFLFVGSSLLCCFAWNLQSMIAFRFFQGLSGGTLIPLSFQVILLFMPPSHRVFGLTIFGLIATLAPTIGPSLGGWLTENYGWRSIFLINILPGFLTILAIRYGVARGKTNLAKLKKVDLFSLITLVLGLGSLSFVLEEGAKVNWFEDHSIRVCMLVTITCLIPFVTKQLITLEPLLNIALLKNRNFGISGLITLISAAALYGGVYALSLYLSQIQNYSAIHIGQVMMWVGIPQLFVMPLVPALTKKIDLRVLSFFGLLLFALSNYMNSQLDYNYSGAEFRVALIIRSIGQPFFIIPLSVMAMSLVEPKDAGNASSIYNVMRNLGGSIGIALTGTFLVSRHDLHFQRHIENVSLHEIATQEILVGISNLLRMNGIDSVNAKLSATDFLIKLAHREALISAYSDIFWVMSIALVVCASLILFLKKLKTQGLDISESQSH